MGIRAVSTNEWNVELDLGALLARHPELRIARDDYNINVTANYGQPLTPSEVMARYAEHPGAGQPAHLYFHVPLCSYICHYCNYVKQLLPAHGNPDAVLARWTETLVDESSRYLERVGWLKEARIESFFIGGGTGALLGIPHLKPLMEHVRANYQLTEDCELTLEGNPDNFTEALLAGALALGFNRFSMGVQSFQDEVNEFTRRGHSAQASLEAISRLKASGRPFNVDLMFGLPYQTPETVRRDLEIVTEAGAPTITIYRLRNADRQKMGIGNRAAWNAPHVRDRLEAQGLFPTLAQTYQMREAAVRVLLERGYRPSPCGWWNAPGTYPEGNIPRVSRNKWQRYDTMVAFGPGAYGWLTGRGSEVVQTHNEADIATYLKRMSESREPPLAPGRLLVGPQAVASALGFAYKANQPISVERFRSQFGVELLRDEPYRQVLEELLAKGLLERCHHGTELRPTLEGEALHEEIISVYIHERIGSFSPAVCNRLS